MQFIDEAKIHLKSGSGGNGCVSFRREKFVPLGGPDGGDGGRGGSIILVSNSHLNTLSHYRYKQQFKARNGEGGKGSNRNGKAAENLILEVPVGTQIFDEESNLILFDFTHDNQECTILSGGKGGLGNIHFKSSVNQAPERATNGQLGEEATVWLKLKLLSDVGLIGLPNSGKSTFLMRTTAAKPKIADYPFTTLSPNLGVVRINDEEFILADIPGLIEGAHTGYGLGDRFLKHIERCRILVHLIDISSSGVIEDYKIIRNELESYCPKLINKTEIICLNKCDLLPRDEVTAVLQSVSKQIGKKVYGISTANNVGLNEILKSVLQLIKEKD